MVSHEDIIKKLDDQGFKKKDDFFEDNIVSIPGSSPGNEFDDLVKITREFLSDENVFKTGFTKKPIFWITLLKTLSEIDIYRLLFPERKIRYIFMERFCFNYAVNMSSLNGAKGKSYVGITEGLLGFRGAISYKEAGYNNIGYGEEEKKKSIKERILGR